MSGRRNRRTSKALGVVLLAGALFVASCEAAKERLESLADDIDKTFGQDVADNPQDRCYDERVALRDSGNSFTEDLATLATIGGSLLLAGGLITGNETLAAAGGLTALAGVAANAYLNNLQANTKNDAELLSKMNGDAIDENQRIRLAREKARNLYDCRQEDAAQIAAELEKGTIDKPTAMRRRIELKERVKEDRVLIDGMSQKVRSRTDELTDAYGIVQTGVPDVKVKTLKAKTASRVRSGPGTDFTTLLTLAPGDSILVTGEQKGWSKVVLNDGREAWVFADLLVPLTEKIVATKQVTPEETGLKKKPDTKEESLRLIQQATLGNQIAAADIEETADEYAAFEQDLDVEISRRLFRDSIFLAARA